MPHIFLHSWSWFHNARRKGLPEGYSGRAFTIMAKPRAVFGEVGDGFCSVLVPHGEERKLMDELVKLRRLKVEDPELLARYRGLLEARWQLERNRLTPGSLRSGDLILADGDVLACSCSAADALAGKCHRTWAAPFLARAGWEVRQDGKDIHA
jgi:hypothetical protein